MIKNQEKHYKTRIDSYKQKYRLLYKLPFARPIYKLVLEPLLNFLVKIDPLYKYNSEGLITDKNTDFMREPEFIKAFGKRIVQTPELKTVYGGEWILHVNQWAVNHTKNLEGDFVECGVYKGALAAFNMSILDFDKMKNRKYYLFDTFRGLDKDWSSEREYNFWKHKYKEDTYDFVKKSFGKYKNVVIVKGTVPLSLKEVDIKKVAYLSLDMNCALPEKKALEFFWDKMVEGGIVILDDYGWPGHEEQKKTADEFASLKNVKILYCPTGQGIIIKPKTKNKENVRIY